MGSRESTWFVETSLTTSAVSRDTLPVQAAGAGSHKPMSRRRQPWLVVVSRVECPLSALNPSLHHNGVAHQTSLRSRTTMMMCANSLHVREAGSLTILPVTKSRTTSPRRHPRIQASPLRRL